MFHSTNQISASEPNIYLYRFVEILRCVSSPCIINLHGQTIDMPKEGVTSHLLSEAYVPGAIPKLSPPSPSWHAPSRNQQEYYISLWTANYDSVTTAQNIPAPYHTGPKPKMNQPSWICWIFFKCSNSAQAHHDFTHSHGGTLQDHQPLTGTRLTSPSIPPAGLEEVVCDATPWRCRRHFVQHLKLSKSFPGVPGVSSSCQNFPQVAI